MQNKILEAMAMELPCITTTICNSAIQAIDHQQILIANTAQEFVDAYFKIAEDISMANQIKLNARRLIEEQYDWKSCNDALKQVLLKFSGY